MTLNLEVAIEGKGSICINQKVDLEGKALRKLASHAVDLLTQIPGKGTYGFSAGSNLDTEVSPCDG